MTGPEELRALLASPRETRGLEFKEAKTQLDLRTVYEYCVALANEGGGRLVLGVSDKVPRQVVGSNAFQNPQKTEEQILSKLGFRVDISVLELAEGRVLVFSIPGRPRGTAYDLEGRYLMRSGESVAPMTEDRLRVIFDEGKPEWLSLPAIDGCSAEAVVDLLDTQSFFELFGLPYPERRESVLDRLAVERVLSESGATWSISNLGALLFAKQIDRFEGVARRAPRVIVYDGTSKVRTKRDEIGKRGYAVGFQGLVSFIESQTPSNEVVEQALRREVKMFPSIAVRELVANALIHQDFSASGASVMVEIYGDRLEISNPGQPPIAADRLIDEYRSRNDRLAEMMRRIRICEEKGSGIDKVVEAAEVFQLPAPEWRIDNVRTTAILFGHRPFSKMDRADRIRACYQHCALRYVMREKASNQTLRARFGLSDDRAEAVSRILRDTTDAGLIRLEDPASGSRKYARYLPYWA